MDYLRTNLKWEDHFIQESVVLDEKMSSFDIDALSKSKIRLSLENKILDWKKYESWVLENLGCASLKSTIDESVLKNFINNSQQAYDIYSNYDFWNEDLLPIFIWESQLVIFGIQYNENLAQIKNHVFILAPPEVLTYFAKAILHKENSEDELEQLERSYSKTLSRIEGLDMEVKAPVLDFKTINLENAESADNSKPSEENENTVWEFIKERHDEYSFEAKKQFSAYVVLKINYGTTKVFKMDPDLEKKHVNEQLFTYDLKQENPFRRVFETGVSESFSISQLGFDLLNFKYVCITALKRADKIVGFLVGFKESNLSEADQVLLEDLAKESAA